MKNTTKTAAEPKKVESAERTATVLESTSELGEVRIHENVISALVRKSALSVEGVSRLAGNALVDNIAEFVGSRRMQSRAISIEMGENNRVSIEVKINILFGFNIPQVSQAVQKAVLEGVESVTGMTVTKVHVIVQEIEEPAPVEEEDEQDGVADVPPIN